MDSNLWSLPRGWVVQLKPISRALSDRCYPVGRLVRQMPVAWCEPDQESRMVLKIERFQPEGMNVRMSGGKPSYSHVMR